MPRRSPQILRVRRHRGLSGIAAQALTASLWMTVPSWMLILVDRELNQLLESSPITASPIRTAPGVTHAPLPSRAEDPRAKTNPATIAIDSASMEGPWLPLLKMGIHRLSEILGKVKLHR